MVVEAHKGVCIYNIHGIYNIYSLQYMQYVFITYAKEFIIYTKEYVFITKSHMCKRTQRSSFLKYLHHFRLLLHQITRNTLIELLPVGCGEAKTTCGSCDASQHYTVMVVQQPQTHSYLSTRQLEIHRLVVSTSTGRLYVKEQGQYQPLPGNTR